VTPGCIACVAVASRASGSTPAPPGSSVDWALGMQRNGKPGAVQVASRTPKSQNPSTRTRRVIPHLGDARAARREEHSLGGPPARARGPGAHPPRLLREEETDLRFADFGAPNAPGSTAADAPNGPRRPLLFRTSRRLRGDGSLSLGARQSHAGAPGRSRTDDKRFRKPARAVSVCLGL
jgi:hypothetical protein